MCASLTLNSKCCIGFIVDFFELITNFRHFDSYMDTFALSTSLAKNNIIYSSVSHIKNEREEERGKGQQDLKI